MKSLLFSVIFICCGLTSALPQFAQTTGIIPMPVSMKMPKTAGKFLVTPQTKIVLLAGDMQNAADFLNHYLNEVYGFQLEITTTFFPKSITLNSIRLDGPLPGAYELKVNNNEISIEGEGGIGSFYGIQTLIQLLPMQVSKALSIPHVVINDRPRFDYRGLHLDVGRHFFSVDYIKKYIDYIAMHKMNYFHWHLTEDQGWRIEIRKYPLLTEKGSYRNGTIIGRYPGKGSDNKRYGGYYTQAEIKDVVEYAAKRYITIVPEIEMPGHASAAIAAYPQLSCFPLEKTKIPENMIADASRNNAGKLVQETWGVFDDVFCAGNDTVFNFLEDLIDEVVELFPGKYIHVGGDESPKTHWKKCPKCQKRMKENNLKDEHQLQSYFIQRMEKYINGKGKTLVGWDEILEGGLAPNAIVMSWRGEKGGIEAAKQKHQVIMTPTTYVYLDYSQTRNEDSVTIGGYLPLQKVYGYEPLSKELTAEQSGYILGAQGNVWTEYMSNPAKVEYMIFPRVTALSEVLWSPKEKRSWPDFEKRLQIQFKRYGMWKANHSNAYYDLVARIIATPNNEGVFWSLESSVKNGKIVYTADKTKNDLVPYVKPILVKKNMQLGAAFLRNGASNTWIWQNFSINKATGKKITLTTSPREEAPGNEGAFGLINGVQSKKGANSSEWLGWQGVDMEAIIDLGKGQTISTINVHVLAARGSQPCKPQFMEAYGSMDGKNYTQLGKSTEVTADSLSMANIKIGFSPVKARFTKVLVKNFGIIPDGMRGAGNVAWLFVDEIQVD